MLKSIFISSSGDLKAVRQGLHDDLYAWLDRHGSAHLLKPYLWEEDKEDGKLLSDRLPIQNQLLDPASPDVPLTICLFGERCGSPLEDELGSHVRRRLDRWIAEPGKPGLRHPWPVAPEEQDRALDCGQYPLTGTVFELLSAHMRPDDADNLIVACVVDRPVMPETPAESIVFNGRTLHARLTAGCSKTDTERVEAEIYDPQVRALLNLLKDHARKVRFVSSYQSEDEMRREVFKIAQKKLRERLGIASLNNPFKQSLHHWTVDDDKPLPGRSEAVRKIVNAMSNPSDFILLKGRSGCGKSSLMQSGVMSRLREIDGSVPVPFRPTELIAGSGQGDALEKLAELIAETAGLPFVDGGPAAMRPTNYAKRLRSAVERERINLVLGLDQFEEIIDELKLEKERGSGTPQSGWWQVVHFLKELCGSPHVRLIATLESARERSFQNLRIGEAIGLQPNTINVDATEDTVAEIARNGFANGGLPLDRSVIEAIKRRWTAFNEETPSDNASPLPLACLFFHRLYERFADRAGATADERLENAFHKAGIREGDWQLTLEEIGGEDAIAFSDIIQNLADEAWRAGGGDPNFTDPIENDGDYVGLNNFLKPLVTVDRDGQIQLRAAVETDADTNTRRQRRAFHDRRLLVPVRAEGPVRLRPVHQALIDRWSPARRWLDARKQHLQIIQRFREDAVHFHRNGEHVPVKKDGSTLRAAALTLAQHVQDWQFRRSGPLDSEQVAIRDQALAVFETAQEPLTLIEGSPVDLTYAHLAAQYHRVALLRRFAEIDPRCLKVEDNRGDNPLYSASWSGGPAVPYLIGQGVPLKTEANPWNAIAPAIMEKIDENFGVMIEYLNLDEDIYTEYKCKLIHVAAHDGNLHVTEYLINHGATLSVEDCFERTALHYTALQDQVEAFRKLLPHIDVQKQDLWKATPVSTAALAGAAHVLAAYVENESDVDRLTAVLLHRNDDGDTPLMIAARHRQPDALRVLMQPDLGALGDPSAAAHRGENGDTLFHLVFRSRSFDTPTEADRFRARTVVELLLQDRRLSPNISNDQGETPFDLGGSFPEARRVLREDARVPRDYANMTPAMRIEDLSSRRPTTVLRLLEEAPQALTDTHEQVDEGGVGPSARSKSRSSADAPAGETGLEILIRLKNYAVLATLADDPSHWPTLREQFHKLLSVAAVPSAQGLREALRRRFENAEVGSKEAGDLLNTCLDADDMPTARALADCGAPITLSRDSAGHTVLHRAAVHGEVERFRSVLDIGRLAVPLDGWGRRPSDLAADPLVETIRALEGKMDDPTEVKAATSSSSSMVGQPPYLSLERDDAARTATESEMAVLHTAWDDDWGDIGAFDIRVFDVPFYADVPLMELRPRSTAAATGRLCFLLSDDSLYRLNGTSPPIHEVNAKQKPRIGEDTVLQYLAFFCFFVRGEEGPFLIVDRPENGFLPDYGDQKTEVLNVFRPARSWIKDEDGNWLLSGVVCYSNAHFFADFRVQPSGMVEMVDDTPLVADLPASVDAPLEIRSLH